MHTSLKVKYLTNQWKSFIVNDTIIFLKQTHHIEDIDELLKYEPI